MEEKKPRPFTVEQMMLQAQGLADSDSLIEDEVVQIAEEQIREAEEKEAEKNKRQFKLELRAFLAIDIDSIEADGESIDYWADVLEVYKKGQIEMMTVAVHNAIASALGLKK